MDDSLLAPFDITVHFFYIFLYAQLGVYASDVKGECWGMHKVVCLELDTFLVLRGQGQISDINKDGHVSQL
jgi:hypothetical protein